MSILNLELLERSVIEADSVPVLLFPLFGDLLLLNHHGVRSLFVTLVPLLGLEELILQVSYLNIAFVVKLVNTAVEDDLQAVQLGDGTLLLVSQLVDQLSQTVIVVEVALVVAHIGV